MEPEWSLTAVKREKIGKNKESTRASKQTSWFLLFKVWNFTITLLKWIKAWVSVDL